MKKSLPWIWTKAREGSFQGVKNLFKKETPVLAVYSPQSEPIVTRDASNSGLGATLTQIQDDGSRRLIAAASRSLTETEDRYAAIEKRTSQLAGLLRNSHSTYLV